MVFGRIIHLPLLTRLSVGSSKAKTAFSRMEIDMPPQGTLPDFEKPGY